MVMKGRTTERRVGGNRVVFQKRRKEISHSDSKMMGIQETNIAARKLGRDVKREAT